MPADPRAYHLEIDGLTQNPRPRGGAGPTRDPSLSSALHAGNLGRDAAILIGRVVDAVAYAHVYKVQLERGAGTLICCAGGSTSYQVSGATSLHSYQPGTQVAIMRHQQMSFGVILCAIPDWSSQATDALSDMIVQGSNVGMRRDGVHTAPFRTTSSGGIPDFSGSRPLDGLPVGEWGAMAETGLAFFLDAQLAYARVDEGTGLFLFYKNQLARLTGHNLQMWSAGWHRDDADDENDWSSEEGWSPYLWEADGLFANGVRPVSARTATETQVDTPYYGAYEPLDDDAIPFHRRTEFRGYLGQGGRDALAAPSAELTVNRLIDSSIAPGLFEQVLGLDGELGIRSARGVVIAKDPFIAIPKRLLRPDAPTGDRAATYSAAGTFGSGPPHLVGGGPTGTDRDAKYLGRMDEYAYLFNWKSPHPFHYHTADWYLPQEDDLPEAAGYAAPAYAGLATDQYLPAPEPFTVRIDERYGTVLCFPNRAMIALTDDGGIILIDGWGSEFRMMGGEIRQSCAGDAVIATGRNAVTLAGYDVVHRANHSIYASANHGDVRFKAERQFMALAGNGGCGGFLFDSRSNYPVFEDDAHEPVLSGFFVRTKNGPVVLAGREILLSTSLLGGTEVPRHIVLDAGAAKIITNSGVFERRLASAALDLFAGGGVNEFWSDFAQLNSAVVINGNLSYAARVTFDADCATARLDQMQTYAADSLGDVTELAGRTDLATTQFVWPTSAAFRAADLIVHETRWQQAARLAGQTLPVWTENAAVDLAASETHPYPGTAAWVTATGYKQLDLTLYSDTTGTAAVRGAAYETAAYGTVQSYNLDGTYTTVIDPTA